jgi:hypothetical protein
MDHSVKTDKPEPECSDALPYAFAQQPIGEIRFYVKLRLSKKKYGFHH